MMTPSPGFVTRRNVSTIATPTSVVVQTWAGSTVQSQRAAAKEANASGSSVDGSPYPVSELRMAVVRASAIGGASGKSLSATKSGSTSSGNARHFMLVRCRRICRESATTSMSQACHFARDVGHAVTPAPLPPE